MLTILQRVTRYIHFCVNAAAPKKHYYNRPTTMPALRLRSKSALDIKKTKNKLSGVREQNFFPFQDEMQMPTQGYNFNFAR